MDPTYPLVPVVNILSAVLISLTLLASALGRSANAGVVMLGIWLLIVAIWLGADTIVWARDARVVIPVWCKIWAHVAIASDVGVPACSMVIVRRLYNIIYNPRSLVSSRRERIRALAFDICLGMGLPFFIMALLSIIKPVQFVIEEEYGCSSTISGSVLYLVMVDCTSVILPALSIFFYCRNAKPSSSHVSF
ncbi:GPCR fungal pheromone mating factor [Amylostereum chailletii]|nr:GPCR fungal pheromone mating factor [Amylostereum chailletii]